MKFIIIYITHPDELTAKKISSYLVEKKLVACSNLFPITSAYWWKDSVQNDQEWVSIVKTKTELWEQTKTAIESIHPYDVPCIMKMDVEANEAYVKWIKDSTIN